MIWWSRGLTASGLTGFKAYRLIAFLIFFCPKYLGRNHWALTLFHSASICVAFISRISLVNPVSTVAFISSRFLPRADTSRYSSRVSLNQDAVSNPGVSSGMSSTFRTMSAVVWKSMRVGCISVSLSSVGNTDNFG